MTLVEETLQATLDASGQLVLLQTPQLPPGPVWVTIRSGAPGSKRMLTDVIRELAANQTAQGNAGRSLAEVSAADLAQQTEDAERDAELAAARQHTSPGNP